MTVKRSAVPDADERANDKNIGACVLEIKAILKRINGRRSREPSERERARLIALRDRISRLRKGGEL